MPAAITVEHLSKRYLINHQREERYTALRDVLANGVKQGLGKLFRQRTEQSDRKPNEFWALNDVSFEIAYDVKAAGNS